MHELSEHALARRRSYREGSTARSDPAHCAASTWATVAYAFSGESNTPGAYFYAGEASLS
ncbi:MAG: hypothetical protein QOH16_2620 [Gaiellaceae bacterium]|nr:hypothetical protein [Gaiellaceae bacterium]